MDCFLCKKRKLTEWAIPGGTEYECASSNIHGSLGGCGSKLYYRRATKMVVRYNLFKKFKEHTYFIEGTTKLDTTVIYINEQIMPAKLYELPFQYLTVRNCNRIIMPLIKRASKLVIFL